VASLRALENFLVPVGKVTKICDKMVAREYAKMGLGSSGTCIPAARDPTINRNLPGAAARHIVTTKPGFSPIFWSYSTAIQKHKIGVANVET